MSSEWDTARESADSFRPQTSGLRPTLIRRCAPLAPCRTGWSASGARARGGCARTRFGWRGPKRSRRVRTPSVTSPQRPWSRHRRVQHGCTGRRWRCCPPWERAGRTTGPAGPARDRGAEERDGKVCADDQWWGAPGARIAVGVGEVGDIARHVRHQGHVGEGDLSENVSEIGARVSGSSRTGSQQRCGGLSDARLCHRRQCSGWPGSGR